MEAPWGTKSTTLEKNHSRVIPASKSQNNLDQVDQQPPQENFLKWEILLRVPYLNSCQSPPVTPVNQLRVSTSPVALVTNCPKPGSRWDLRAVQKKRRDGEPRTHQTPLLKYH